MIYFGNGGCIEFIGFFYCHVDMWDGYGMWIWEGVDMLGRRNVVINSLWSICIL